MSEKNKFTVPEQYVDNTQNKLELQLKEISFLLFSVLKFHDKGETSFEIPLFPYSINILQVHKHPWILISCKVKPKDKERIATFSFAASTDGQSFQNSSGLIDNTEITQTSLEVWLDENPDFLNLLRDKKDSYKNNFFKA